MAIFAQSGINTILELIRKENPWLPNTLDATNVHITGGAILPDGRAEVLLVGVYGSGYRGSKLIRYGRIDLSKLLGPAKLKVPVDAPKTLYSAFGDIYSATGITFGQGDVQDVPIPLNAKLPYTVTLKPQPDSALYYGEIELEFVERPPKLTEALTERNLEVVFGPVSKSGLLARAELLTFGYDYSEAYLALSDNFLEGTILNAEKAGNLAAILNAVDNLSWNNSGNQFNLTGTYIRYHGATKDYSSLVDIRTPNTYYDRVLIIDFVVDLDGWDFYGSSLYIHYNTLS